MTAIIKKELNAYFRSMTGYVFIGFLVLMTAIYFSFINVLQLSADFQIVLSAISIVFLILIPTLTMRLFADEARQKTDQLLFTSPVPVIGVVAGKFLAALILFLIAMAVTLIFPLSLTQFGELPTANIITAYLGYILLGAAFISVGMFVSVLTDNQIVAAVATFAALFVLFIMNSIAVSLPADRTSALVFVCAAAAGFAWLLYDATRNTIVAAVVAVLGIGAAVALFFANNMLFDGVLVKTFQWLAVMSRFENFNKGVLNLADCVYFITFTAAFIYLTVNVIEKRRWR